MIYRQKATLSAPIIIIFCCCPSARHMEGLVLNRPPLRVRYPKENDIHILPTRHGGQVLFSRLLCQSSVKIAQATNIA